LDFPGELKYSKEHEWIKVQGDTVTVGITEFAQSQLGDVVSVELPRVGDEMEQMKSMAIVDSIKSSSEVYAPVSGTVESVNEELLGKPELVNQEPYGKGWFVKLKVTGRVKDELDELMSAGEYGKFVEKG
jgi:glycine cleavage system H protein